jgi:hypothetical protein
VTSQWLAVGQSALVEHVVVVGGVWTHTPFAQTPPTTVAELHAVPAGG